MRGVTGPPWLGVELAYRDLGNFGTDINFVPFGSPGVVLISPGVALDVQEYSLAARLSAPISSRFDANWTAGISRVDFSVEGGLPAGNFDPFQIIPAGVGPSQVPESKDESHFRAA